MTKEINSEKKNIVNFQYASWRSIFFYSKVIKHYLKPSINHSEEDS